MNVKRILIHRTLVVVVYAAAAVRLALVLLRFLDSTVLHPFKLVKSLELASKRSTIIEFKFTEVFRSNPLIISSLDIM